MNSVHGVSTSQSSWYATTHAPAQRFDSYHLTNLPSTRLSRSTLKHELRQMVGNAVSGARVNLCSNSAHADIDVPCGAPMAWLQGMTFHGTTLVVDRKETRVVAPITARAKTNKMLV